MEGCEGNNNSAVQERLLDMQMHREKHFTAGEIVRDMIMGMSDGLTVPFALAAGLSGANTSSSIIVTAGLAEVAAGAISMGLGGYLAAKSEADHYTREQHREQEEILSVPDTEAAEVADILAKYGLQPNEYWPVVNALQKRPVAWLEFMMSYTENESEGVDPAYGGGQYPGGRTQRGIVREHFQANSANENILSRCQELREFKIF